MGSCSFSKPCGTAGVVVGGDAATCGDAGGGVAPVGDGDDPSAMITTITVSRAWSYYL